MARPNMFDVIRQRNMQDYENARAARAFDPTYNRHQTTAQILQDVKVEIDEALQDENLPEQAPVTHIDALDTQELPPEGVAVPEPPKPRRKKAAAAPEPTSEPVANDSPEAPVAE